MMKKEKLIYLAQSGIIAAAYAALTLLFYPLSYGLSQLRVRSEERRVGKECGS